MRVDDPQPARAADRALEAQRDLEALGERVDAGPVEGQEEVRLRAAQQRPQLRLGAVEDRVDLLAHERPRDRRARLAAGGLDLAAVLVQERRPVVEGGLRHRAERGADRVRVREFHARQLRAGLRGQQVAVAGEHVAAETAAEKRASAGGDDRRAGVDGPRPALLAAHAGRAGDRAVVAAQQLERRALVPDLHAGAGDLAPHPAHVLGALEARASLPAVVAGRKRIAPVREAPDLLVRLVEHPAHPLAIGQVAAHLLAAGHRRLARLRLRWDVPDAHARRRGRARRAAVALVDEDDRGTGLGGGDRRPASRGAAADHQHVGARGDVVSVGGDLRQGRAVSVRHVAGSPVLS
ncbi:MAG: hypothetical protein R2736_22645 [Solirubrobacterales bacterium]